MAAYQMYGPIVQGGTWYLSIKGFNASGKKLGLFSEYTKEPSMKDREELVKTFEHMLKENP